MLEKVVHLDKVNNRAFLRGTLSYIRKIESRTTILDFMVSTIDERDDGQPAYATLKCRVFGRRAEEYYDKFRDDDPVLIEGRLENHSYKKKDGTKVYEQYVTVLDMVKDGQTEEPVEEPAEEPAEETEVPGGEEYGEDVTDIDLDSDVGFPDVDEDDDEDEIDEPF